MLWRGGTPARRAADRRRPRRGPSPDAWSRRSEGRTAVSTLAQEMEHMAQTLQRRLAVEAARALVPNRPAAPAAAPEAAARRVEHAFAPAASDPVFWTRR
jgi:hypothetical protein